MLQVKYYLHLRKEHDHKREDTPKDVRVVVLTFLWARVASASRTSHLPSDISVFIHGTRMHGIYPHVTPKFDSNRSLFLFSTRFSFQPRMRYAFGFVHATVSYFGNLEKFYLRLHHTNPPYYSEPLRVERG